MAEAATKLEQTEAAPAAAPKGAPVTLKERYQIFPAAPLPQLNSPHAPAFEVQDKREPGRQLFALQCHPGLPARTNAMDYFRGNRFHGLLQLVEWGVIDWPPLERRVIVAVFERPEGGRVSDVLRQTKRQVSQHDIAREFIEPIVHTLKDLATRGVPHRGIRPDNLFYMDAARTQVVLGDCVTTPPGYDQPVVFETIERGMADPAGRGKGDFADDFYALGVTLIFLLLGGNPVGKLNDTGILYRKINDGSYTSLCGQEPIPLSLLEPLRGLLADVPEQRWTLEELELWLDGRRLTPLQKKPAAKAERDFPFAKFKHTNVRTLSVAMGKPENQAEALKVIQDGSLEAWLRRGLDDAEMAASVASAVSGAANFSPDRQACDAFMITKVCMVMDPAAPIRFRHASFMPDGLGPALGIEYTTKGQAQVFGEILQKEVFHHWFNLQSGMSALIGEQRMMVQLRGYLMNSDPGYGMERCVYETNASLPCVSPLVAEEFVLTPEQLLPALERAANRVNTSETTPVDRHIAAFLAARFSSDIEPHLRAYAAPEPDTHAIGMLSLLAMLQWKTKIEAVHGLASWVGGLMGPALKVYHSRKTRHEIEREIPKVVRKGSLPELFNLFDNPERRDEDEEEFAVAKREFAVAEFEAERVEAEAGDADRLTRAGQQAAAMTSVVLAIIGVTLLVVMETL